MFQSDPTTHLSLNSVSLPFQCIKMLLTQIGGVIDKEKAKMKGATMEGEGEIIEISMEGEGSIKSLMDGIGGEEEGGEEEGEGEGGVTDEKMAKVESHCGGEGLIGGVG